MSTTGICIGRRLSEQL